MDEHFGQTRFLYNHFLAQRSKEYKENKLTSTYFKDSARLTVLKKELAWLYDTSVTSQQYALKHLDNAFKNFFKKRALYPRFKSKRDNRQSFTVHAKEIRVEGKRIILPKFKEGVKFNRQLPEISRIVSVTVSRQPTGGYYASIHIESDKQTLPPTGKNVGIDLGLTDFAVFSTGKRIKSEKHFTRRQRQLKAAQQHLSRKVKGSKRRERQRIKVASIHGQIANARKEMLHKASAFAIKHYDLIAVETLAVGNMVKNLTLSKSIMDAGWGEFVQQLEYKAIWYGRKVVKVDRYYPSSKACSCCGWINQSLKLTNRTWVCGGCGETHDRDLNAAKNILAEGIILSERQSPNTGAEGEQVQAGLPVRHPSVKRLAKKGLLVQGDGNETIKKGIRL